MKALSGTDKAKRPGFHAGMKPAEEPPKVNIAALNGENRETVSPDRFHGLLPCGQNIVNTAQTLLLPDDQMANQTGFPKSFFRTGRAASLLPPLIRSLTPCMKNEMARKDLCYGRNID